MDLIDFGFACTIDKTFVLKRDDTMALDYQKLREEIRKLGERAPEKDKEAKELRDEAKILLKDHASNIDELRDKVQRAANSNKNLRCAIPVVEKLNATFALPAAPKKVTMIATDGSQINPNRHNALDYALVNVGAIVMKYGEVDAPEENILTELFYDDQLLNMTEGTVATIRDLRERSFLATLAENQEKPVITFIDGGIELWIRELGMAETESFEKYLMILRKLYSIDAITAGYVDKPGSSFVIKLLEIAKAKDNELADLNNNRWLRRVNDRALFKDILGPGERSAIFQMQSPTTSKYEEELSIHFFFINTSLKDRESSIARIEVPKWVMKDAKMFNTLHWIIVDQCQIMHNSNHPYLLTRADEIARVTREEHNQVDNMIALERRKHKLGVGQQSAKQIGKENTAR